MRLSALIIAGIIIGVLVIFFPLACQRIDAGHVGIKINNAGSLRGIENAPLLTGWVFYNRYTQRVKEFPANMQTAKWTKSPDEGAKGNEEISFSSKEGANITADFSMSYVMETQRIPAFYMLFRTDDMDAFTHGYLRNVVRDEINEVSGRYGVEELYGPLKEKWIAECRSNIQQQVASIGVQVRQFGPIGNVRPPDTFLAAINAKITATQNAQRAENELRQATAEAKKAVATAEGQKNSRIAIAQGEAEANRLLTQSLTSNLLEWRRLEIEQKAVDRWKGEVPTTVMGGQSPVPFINMTPKQ